MEYINAAADDDANEFFADIEHHITSLHLIVQLFFMMMSGKQSGITNALTGKPMFFCYNMRI
jgi:hypothetical protein